MTEIALYQLDAFASARFAGNPAAVCPLQGDWLPATVMQAIAAENNLSETAFLLPCSEGYAIRWFTPAIEVDLWRLRDPGERLCGQPPPGTGLPRGAFRLRLGPAHGHLRR